MPWHDVPSLPKIFLPGGLQVWGLGQLPAGMVGHPVSFERGTGNAERGTERSKMAYSDLEGANTRIRGGSPGFKPVAARFNGIKAVLQSSKNTENLRNAIAVLCGWKGVL